MKAWELHTPQRMARNPLEARSLGQVPVEFTTFKDTAVIVPMTVGQSGLIYVWDLRSDRFQKIGPFSVQDLWHAEQDENILVTFEFDWDAHPPEVQQTKWRLDTGKQLDRKKFTLSPGARRVNKKKLARSISDWFRTYDHKTMTELRFTEDPYATMHLMYDYKVDRLSVHWIECKEPINKLSWYMGKCGSLTPYITYRWAHQLRGIGIYSALTGTATVQPYQLDQREVSVRSLLGPSLPPPSHPMSPEDLRISSLKVFGDREVVCVASSEGIQLWFFNPDFLPNIPGAQPFSPMEESG